MKDEIVKQVIEKGGVDVVVEYVKKFIEAATPVAKQAYEIGLMTLQIDAMQSVLIGIVWLSIAAFCTYFVPKWYRECDPKDEDDPRPYFVIFGSFVGFISWAGALIQLLSIWTWVKLFRPELWLAHEAIEKLVK